MMESPVDRGRAKRPRDARSKQPDPNEAGRVLERCVLNDPWRSTPSFIVFGHMSDRIGRKKTLLAGCGLAALTHVPIYIGMKHFGNPGGLPAPDHRRAESHD